MEDFKLNIKEFLKSIFRSLSNPVFALDNFNNILEMSDSASALCKSKEYGINLSQILNDHSYKKLNELIKSTALNKSYILSEEFSLKFRNSTEIISNLAVNYINYEDDYIILVSLITENVEESLLGFTKIDIRSGNPVESILNPRLKKVLHEIRNLFPLTVTGKERLKKIIDEFDEFIRVKNDQGNFVLVNSAYAQSLGIAVSQLEGKSESDLLPPFVKDFINSINRYLVETHNYIIIEGMPLKGISNAFEQQVIEIPVTDYQNNVIAVVGITQNKQINMGREISAEIHLSGEIIDAFPKPLAFIDQYGKFQHASLEFCKLVSSETGLLYGIHTTEILTTELSEIIKLFQNSNSAAKEFFVNLELLPCGEEEAKYKIFLNKITISEIDSEGVFIYVDEAQINVDLNQLILQRGKMFDILIQNNPEPIFIYDIDNLRFLEVNDAVLQLYSYSRDEFLQMDLTDLYTPEDIQTLLGSSFDDSGTGKFVGPYRHKTKNGDSVFVEISKTKFQFNGKDSYFNIVKDVSSRLELEKKNQLFKAAFDNTNDTVLITDANGFINFINNSGSKLLGYSANELENTSFTALVKDEDRSMINTSVFVPEIIEPVSLLLDIKKSDGSFLNTELSFTPIIDFSGQVDSFSILLKLVKHKEEMQVKEVVKEVIIERNLQGESELLDPDFLSGVFHEILTPMNVILGFAQELTESIENPSPEQKEASTLINQNKIKLLSTMNSVVEYSELLQHKAEFNYTDVSITQLIEKIDIKIPELMNTPDTQLSYGKISSSMTFKTDLQKFETLISSLIKVIARLIKDKKIYFSSFPLDEENFIILISDNYNNCSDYLISKLKLIYTGKNDIKDLGTPKLTTHLSRTLLTLLGGSLMIDEKFGAGFRFPKDIPMVWGAKKFESIDDSIEELIHKEEPDTFDPFSQSDILEEQDEIISESELVKEADLISAPLESTDDGEAKPAIDKLSETEAEPEIDTPISPTSHQDEIKLSEELSEDVSPAKEKVKMKPGSKLEISNLSCLYIEDQVDSQILFKVQMKGLKEVKFAVSFEEALPLLETRTFDFIVMDINLQGEYNGLDALKIINKMQAHENTPVIAVTAYVLPGDKEKFIATGFNDFVSKPIFREKMIESLERVFSK